MKEKQMPKYLQLKRELLSWLHSGALKPNDQLPSEHEIAEQFQMSRQTVRQALGELEREGWVYRVQGKGTFVSGAPMQNKGNQTHTIGIITTSIADYIFPHIVYGAESTLRNEGYRLLLSSTDNDKAKERESLQMLLGQPLSGLIIEPTKSTEGNPNLSYFLSLDYYNIPYVMINERYPEISCPCLKLDDEMGGFLAVEHLIKLGHRRIAGFFKTDDLQGVNRLKGFIRAHRQYGIPLLPERVVNYVTEEKRTKPYELAKSMLLWTEERPSAFVCYNDELAVLLLEAARQSDISIPQDLSLVGFDDSSLATATEVKLTTLTHPKAEMGEDAAELLIQMIESRLDSQKPSDKIYKPELIVRESTRSISEFS